MGKGSSKEREFHYLFLPEHFSSDLVLRNMEKSKHTCYMRLALWEQGEKNLILLLCSRPCSQHLAHINSFKPPNDPTHKSYFDHPHVANEETEAPRC